MTTIHLTGGDLGDERVMVRCNLAEASAPVEVDYCNGDGRDIGHGFEPTQYQCADANHTTNGLTVIAKRLAARAVEMPESDFDCDAIAV